MPKAKKESGIAPRPTTEKQARAGRKNPEQTAKPRRKRRSSDQVSDLILKSARNLFSQTGYAHTTTKAIADAAGVAEHIIFRHFGGKAALFERSVFVPFEKYLEDYLDTWQQRTPGAVGTAARAREYVESVYGQLHRDRQLWRALILSMQSNQKELGRRLHGARSPLSRFLETLGVTAGRSMQEAGWNAPDVKLAVRITFGYLFSLTVFDDLFFAGTARPTRKHLIDEMAAYMLYGISRKKGTVAKRVSR
jgi:AcrR family transcriptional regulator